MNYKKKRANFEGGKVTTYGNNDYLAYLTALRKFFTNDTDIIPIVEEFNFYINGVFSTPYVDLFRMYEENMEDIHGAEKTKQFIDDGTVGTINNQIYNNGNGSLIASLESLRVYMLDRSKKYRISYNTFINAYAEVLIPVVNVLKTSDPVVTTNGIDLAEPDLRNPIDPLQDPIKPKQIGGTKASLPPKLKTKIAKKNPLKMLFSKLSFLSKKTKKPKTETPIEKYYREQGENYNNLNKG